MNLIPEDKTGHKQNILRLSKVVVISVLLLIADQNLSAQSQDDWSCFHGSDRTNKSRETGLLQSWPSGGPRLHLIFEGLGEGYSSVSIADGLLYTAGSVNKQPYVYAFDLKGKLVWKKPVGKAWTTTASWASSYTGTRCTPTYDKDVVYFLGEMGRLVAFEAKTGNIILYQLFLNIFLYISDRYQGIFQADFLFPSDHPVSV